MSDLQKRIAIAKALGWRPVQGRIAWERDGIEVADLPPYGSASPEGMAAAWEVLAEIKKRGWTWGNSDGVSLYVRYGKDRDAYVQVTGPIPFPTALGEAFVAADRAMKETEL